MSRDAEPLFFSRTYDYLEVYLPRQVGRSPETVESYRDALTVFRRYCADVLGRGVRDLRFADVGRDCLLGFLGHMRGLGLSAGTCNQRLAAVRAYVRYAAEGDVCLQSLSLALDSVPKVKGPQRLKERLSPDALAAVLAAPDPGRAVGMRDRALLALLYDAALRLSELTGLRVGDCSLAGDDPCVYVTGKGSKERAVAICARTASHISQVVAVYHGPAPDPGSPVFCHRVRGALEPLSASSVQRIVDKYADAARKTCPEVPEKCHPHMFRRTRATDLYQAGVPLELVSRVLGHSAVETTRAYAVPSEKMLREAMESSAVPSGAEDPRWAGDEEALARLCGLR